MAVSRVQIIAEVGVNHNGDVDRALEMIHAAADAGADIVKFQTFSAERLATKTAEKAKYQQIGDAAQTQYEMLKALELPEAVYPKLLSECASAGIEFLSTGFDIDDLEFLVGLGVSRLKIPSGEITHVPYLRAAAGFGLPIIMSTGMSQFSEIDNAVNILKLGSDSLNLSLLHCTSAYPTPLVDVNLRAMGALAERYKLPVGYSDHTLGLRASTAAVALGAKIIEKHFTLDTELPGPDHKASATAEELTKLVQAIRDTESLLGDSRKEPRTSELGNISIARRSVVAKTEIKKGERYTNENLCCKRTGSGVSADCWDTVLGQLANRDYRQDESIEL
jgi:N,N'-diacetyllegionaminate synthase